MISISARCGRRLRRHSPFRTARRTRIDQRGASDYRARRIAGANPLWGINVALTLEQLADRIGATVRSSGDAGASVMIERCASLADAGPGDVSFLANPRYVDMLPRTNASAVIVSADVNTGDRPALIAEDPYFAFRQAMLALHRWREHSEVIAAGPGASGPAHPGAQIDPSVRIHPSAVICENATIGRDCVIYPNVFIGPDVRIGADCVLYAGVTIYEACVLGDRVSLHAGCSIGQDGFGYATHDGAHHKIPPAGNVVIADDVEMGANCAVDRATMGSTIIGIGTKFSNGVTIGHGCRIGTHNLFSGMVGFAGSIRTGDYVVIGGQVGVAGHLTIGHRVQIAAQSGVMENIPDDTRVGGSPALPLADAKRRHIHTQRLPDLVARLKQLERDVEQLKDETEP